MYIENKYRKYLENDFSRCMFALSNREYLASLSNLVPPRNLIGGYGTTYAICSDLVSAFMDT